MIQTFLKTFWYWLLTGILLLLFFVSKGHSFSQTFYFISFLLPVVMGTSYYVNEKLIPDVLLRKKNVLFAVYLIYTIIISLYLQYLVIFLALYLFTSFQLDNQSIITMNISNLSLTLYLMVVIKVVIEIIQKLNQKETLIKTLEHTEKENLPPSEKILIRSNRINHPISLSTIVYIESLSDYIKVVTDTTEIVSKEKISTILERLPSTFKRTHRSFIVNTEKINSYTKEFITLGAHQIPISRTYKKEIVAFLEKC